MFQIIANRGAPDRRKNDADCFANEWR